MGFNIGKSFGQILRPITKGVAFGVGAGIGVKSLDSATDIFRQVAGGLVNQVPGGGTFASSIPLNLPNPLSALNPLLGGLGDKFYGAGDFLSRVGDVFTGNRNIMGYDGQMNLPQFAQRSSAMNDGLGGILDQFRAGSYGQYPQTSGGDAHDPVVGSSDYSPSNPLNASLYTRGSSNIFSADLSNDQKEMLKHIPDKKQRAIMELQFKMQNQMEMVQMISNMQKMQSETRKSIIQNWRS